MTMRLSPALLLALTLLLAGCGSETPEAPEKQADDPSPAQTEQVAVVSESAVGGAVAPEAVDLADEAALEAFVAQFEDDRMATALDQVVAEADLADGQTLAGAVVAIGCVPPKRVTVDRTGGGLEIVAVLDKKAEQPQVECLVPVTSVGVVAVDESLL